MYKYYFRYNSEGEDKLIEFPLAPESLNTKEFAANKRIETIGLGEINLIKEIGLRELSFKVYLPRKIEEFNAGYNSTNYAPINILAALREILMNKCVVTLIIERTLPDGEKIFNGNLRVTLEKYFVEEIAGQEGSFWVDIRIKEYKDFTAEEYEIIASEEGSNMAVKIPQRIEKNTAKSYVVKSGDSLWKIAKRELNDGSRYMEIARLNNISNPNKISVGMNLRLP